MPDTRSHRGPHPDDHILFSPEKLPLLGDAVADFSWLLSRGYSADSALKVVGDRYQLTLRQRIAAGRLSCSLHARDRRRSKLVGCPELAGQTLALDGFNILTTIEAALAGGLILRCLDGSFRDLAGLHGTWRRVSETSAALSLIARFADRCAAARCLCFLDAPVSNSGRLKTFIEQWTADCRAGWEVMLVKDPDKTLIECGCPVVTSDSRILDGCAAWFNITEHLLPDQIPGAWVIDFFKP